jgi:hypothetical protein
MTCHIKKIPKVQIMVLNVFSGVELSIVLMGIVLLVKGVAIPL